VSLWSAPVPLRVVRKCWEMPTVSRGSALKSASACPHHDPGRCSSTAAERQPPEAGIRGL